MKYFISSADLMVMAKILAKTLLPDPHGGKNREYWIRSLYFDTIDNLDFYNKLSGTYRRKKIRLRIYDIHQKKIKLEIKNKMGDHVCKDIFLLGRDETEDLINGHTEVLLNHPDPTCRRVYYYMQKNFYRPCALVEYEREAYISAVEAVRLTFDKNIRSNGTNFDIFNPNIPMNPVFDNHAVVLEVKFNRFLPEWIKDILKTFHHERYAISKYCLSRSLFY